MVDKNIIDKPKRKGETGNRSKITVNVQLEKFLKKLFIDKNIKQTRIAEALNIQRASIGDKISRSGKMSVDALATIADVIGCDFEVSFIDRQTGEKWTCSETVRNNSDGSEV